jgi:hypothetical protein
LCRTRQKPHAQLWDQSLLHQPAKNDVRKRYQERIGADLRTAIISEIAHQRSCSASHAAQLLDTLIEDSLSGLIASRTALSIMATRQHFDQQRVEQATAGLIRPLPADLRRLITTRSLFFRVPSFMASSFVVIVHIYYTVLARNYHPKALMTGWMIVFVMSFMVQEVAIYITSFYQ